MLNGPCNLAPQPLSACLYQLVAYKSFLQYKIKSHIEETKPTTPYKGGSSQVMNTETVLKAYTYGLHRCINEIISTFIKFCEILNY